MLSREPLLATGLCGIFPKTEQLINNGRVDAVTDRYEATPGVYDRRSLLYGLAPLG
jgi:hypothetical protein